MRQSDTTRLINESNHAMRFMVGSFAVSIVALLVFFFKVAMINDVQAIALIATISISLLLATLYLFRYARFNGMMRDDEPPTPVTYEDVSDVLNFPASHAPATATVIEVTAGTNILRSKPEIQPDYGTLGDLADSLYANNWYWSRDNAVQGSYKNLTARYGGITAEMKRMKIIAGRPNNYYVTMMGQTLFINESPNLELEHMIRHSPRPNQ